MHRPKPTSAENGRRSRGPITAEGKEQSRLAALQHGLCAKTIVKLPEEDDESFDENFHDYVSFYQPVGNVQFDYVSDMAAANWRLGRALAIEKALFSVQRQSTPQTENGADVYLPVFDSQRFNSLQIYIARIERSHQRALNNFLKARRYAGEAEEQLEILASPEAPRRGEDEIRPEPETSEPEIAPVEPAPAAVAQPTPVPTRPPAPEPPKTPADRRKSVDPDPARRAIPPDDRPKAA